MGEGLTAAQRRLVRRRASRCYGDGRLVVMVMGGEIKDVQIAQCSGIQDLLVGRAGGCEVSQCACVKLKWRVRETSVRVREISVRVRETSVRVRETSVARV